MGAMRFPAAALFSLWTMIFSSAASGAELAPLVLGTVARYLREIGLAAVNSYPATDSPKPKED
jgi:hypothetical protein